MYDMNHRRIKLDDNEFGPPWWARWLTYMVKAITQSGGDVDAATHLHEWILNNPNFEDVVYKEFWLPAVPLRPDASNDSEDIKNMDDGWTDDSTVCVPSMVFLSALSHSCRLSFGLVALSFWEPGFHWKPLICSRRIAWKSSEKNGFPN